jgi:hypothetical protein
MGGGMGGHAMGGGMGGHAMGGGMGGGMGMHSMGGAMGMHPMGFSAVHPGASFAAMPMTRGAVSPAFSGWHGSWHAGPHFAHFGFHHHNHFRRFFFVGGAPYDYSDYSSYDDCLRRVWTGYGVRWINVCGDYGY